LTIKTLTKSLEKQAKEKWDKKVETGNLSLTPNARVMITNGDRHSYSLTDPAHIQLADKMEIPVKYYRKMLEESPKLLAKNVNHWLEKEEKEYFIRGLGRNVRAVLSPSYRVIDHQDVLMCALTKLEGKAKIENAELNERFMHIKFKCPDLKSFVKRKGDKILGGVLLSNSETGHGAVRVQPRIFRVQCSNGMVIEDIKTRQVHLGNGDEVGDRLVYAQIAQSIEELFSRFGEVVERLRNGSDINIGNPSRVINNVVKQFGLSDKQKENILMAFGAEPDQSQYGIANAVTRAAHSEENFEAGLDLEKLGGRIITMNPRSFLTLDAEPISVN